MAEANARIEASCVDVRGMVYGIAYMQPGDRFRTNFGERKFVCDTVAFEGGLAAFSVQPAFGFRTSEFVDPNEPQISKPDERFIG
jgi:hypothetical protein